MSGANEQDVFVTTEALYGLIEAKVTKDPSGRKRTKGGFYEGARPRWYGNDLNEREKQFLQYISAWMVFDFRQMYAFFPEKGFRGTPQEVARQTRRIGHPPRRFEDYAREAAAAWKASA